MGTGNWGRIAFFVCLGVAWSNLALAQDILFKNGQHLHGARIVSRTSDSISIQVANGVIRYPLSALQSIDGQPVDMPLASVSVQQPAPPPPAPSQAPVVQKPAVASHPASTSSVAAAPAAVKVPAASVPRVSQDPSTAHDRWNFDLFLLGFLVIGGFWMRGLHDMQTDLYERRVEPRYWVTAGVLLPVVGAGAYFLTLYVQRKSGEARIAKALKARAREGAAAAGTASGTGAPFPFAVPQKFDPAQHMAKKGHARKGLTFLDNERRSIAIKGDGEVASGLDNASELLEEALLEEASDIHIEPASDVYRVRFRLDGIMHERMSFSPSDGLRVVTAIKSLAEIDIAEKRKAQDGKFRVKSDGREVDFRVATASSIYGEKVVIRVLDAHSGVYDLNALGMSAEMIAQFQRVINSRSGMILATGPTGSGKTSTLYAALRQLDGASLNIMTIEDPVEYELAGATQIAVNARANITYEAGLRSILRQDPDVILVGEMRDAEATGVALRAALTGHLVFSSLHTKDAIGTISRLQDMGMERYQVASALLMVLAQRLVRVLCPDCRRKYPAVGNEFESLGLAIDPGASLYASQGCDSCHGTGFKGRTGIFELLVLDEDFRRVFSEGADEDTMGQLAIEKGFRSYRFDGAEKALNGVTTVEEVLRAS
jgi:type II secretory ATPase GspE/PulE/Tfp pilus assembly ATPase PilB-like protein